MKQRRVETELCKRREQRFGRRETDRETRGEEVKNRCRFFGKAKGGLQRETGL
jgi:hypothetical protein